MTINPTRFTQERQPLAQLRVPIPIDVFQCQTTAGTAFTADTNMDFHIESLVATNTTGAADYITVYLVPSGGSAGATNLVVYQRAVGAKQGVTIFNREHMGILQPGATLEVLCGVNDAINIWGHGFHYRGAYG